MKKTLLFIGVMVFVAFIANAQNGFKISHDWEKGHVENNSKSSVVIYEQFTGGFGAQPSTYCYNGNKTFAADDFIIPPGETWNIDSLAWYSAWTSLYYCVNSANIIFYPDNGGVPGEELYSFMNIACYTIDYGTQSGLSGIVLPTAVNLTEGTYWISIQAYFDCYSNFGYWGSIRPIIGNEAQWKNPDGSFIPGYEDWSAGSVVFECDPYDHGFGFYEFITYTITFHVDDGTDPIEGADIIIDGQIVTTSDGGVADVELQQGVYTYTVTADGFDDFTGNYTVTTDANQTISVHMDETVSAKYLKAEDIYIFPNPSTGIIHIITDDIYMLEIIDISGKIVNLFYLPKNLTIQLNDSGVYFFTFNNNKTTIVKRVIVH